MLNFFEIFLSIHQVESGTTQPEVIGRAQPTGMSLYFIEKIWKANTTGEFVLYRENMEAKQ